MKTTSPPEPGRDVALSRSPERRYKMKTTSPKQEMAWSLTELSLVDRIHIHFWALHQTKLCNCNLLSPWERYQYSQKMVSTLGGVDVRWAALEDPCRRRQTQSSTVLRRAPCYPIKIYQSQLFMYPMDSDVSLYNLHTICYSSWSNFNLLSLIYLSALPLGLS